MSYEPSPNPYVFDEEIRPEESPSKKKRNFPLLIVGVFSGVVIAMAGIGLWLLLGGANAQEAGPTVVPSAAQPAPEAPATKLSEEPTPDEETSPVEEQRTPTTEAEQEAEETAAAPSREVPVPQPPKRDQPQTPATPVKPAAAQGPLDRGQALQGINNYLNVVLSDPARGWKLLTSTRQARESFSSYVDWWGSLNSARISNCEFDEGSQLAVCDLVTRNQAGRSAITTGVKFQLVNEDGNVKIGLVDEVTPGNDQAVAALEQYRQSALATTTLDGRWVALLSTKNSGIEDELQIAQNGSNVFFNSDILAMHESLVHRLPSTRVILLHRHDWGPQKPDQDFWQTIADGGFASKAQVQAWCAQSFPELQGKSLENQCLPKELKPPY